MLRFICNICYCMFVSFRISIHLMLRFIMEEETGWNPGSYISIHLMLRFIAQCRFCGQMVQIFQYISCYGLSCRFFIWYFLFCNFNTSHVTVYRCFLFTASCTIIISIHLMLRFIIYPDGEKVNISEFQYISCYGLSELNQNTYEEIKEFQYISCYGLSNMDPWMLFQYCDFNTSHVTVYQSRCCGAKSSHSFQYISCYGLSQRVR